MNRRLLLPCLVLSFLPLAAIAQEGKPQPPLPQEELTIVERSGARYVFHVEIAATEQEQVTGLMFRHSVPADGGMLFVWEKPEISEMWMKNTLVPLDMVFIKNDGTIARIIEDTVPGSLRVLSSEVKVKATLELQGGVTAKLGITVGDKVLSPIFHEVG